MSKRDQIKVSGRQITVSNLDKVLFPGYKFTKAHVIDYYIRISKYLLPHLRNRPITLKRFPDGVFGEFFYEKDAPTFTPDWVKTFPVPRRETRGNDIQYIVVNDLPTLVWLANLATLELHPFLHRIPKISQPTSIVFDCDPGEGATVLECARIALLLRSKLEALGLESLPKVSGSKGLQVYVPLNTPVTYEITQPFARSIAELMARDQPALVVADMAKALRKKKVFIDWSQNSDYKTTVGVYSLRATSYKPLVSMPVTWEEVQAVFESREATPLYFNPEQALARVERLGDLFAPALSIKQKLPAELRQHLSVKTGKRSAAQQTAATGSTKSLRRSRQGSTRRFLIQKTGAGYYLRLELGHAVSSWVLTRLPKTGRPQTARATRDASLDILNPRKRRGRAATWDAGTYQLIEGNMNRNEFRIYLKGDKIDAEWSLTRLPETTTQWRVTESKAREK